MCSELEGLAREQRSENFEEEELRAKINQGGNGVSIADLSYSGFSEACLLQLLQGTFTMNPTHGTAQCSVIPLHGVVSSCDSNHRCIMTDTVDKDLRCFRERVMCG